jgi:hypothetical protein
MPISYGSLEKTHHEHAHDLMFAQLAGELEYNPPLYVV